MEVETLMARLLQLPFMNRSYAAPPSSTSGFSRVSPFNTDGNGLIELSVLVDASEEDISV